MKILVIQTVKFNVNGISNVIMNYYRYTKEKISYDFVANDEIAPAYEKELREDDCNIYCLQHRNKFPFIYMIQLSKIIKKRNYDIVHIHGNSALMSIELLACKLSGTKAVRVVHGHNTDCTHKKLHKILYGYFIKNYNYGIACSRAAGEWLYGEHKYIVLNNGIEEDKFQWNLQKRLELRKQLHIQPDQKIILHIGLFNEQKNHTFLIDIFREVVKLDPDAVLRLIGKGDKQEEIREKVKRYGLEGKVVFVGETLHPEDEYLIADVFVMPSLYESLGLVTVEAQCSGLPCVLSDRIPGEIKITDAVSFMPLEISAKKWANCILQQFGQERKDHRNDVIRKGYSASHGAKNLIKFYASILKQ